MSHRKGNRSKRGVVRFNEENEWMRRAKQAKNKPKVLPVQIHNKHYLPNMGWKGAEELVDCVLRDFYSNLIRGVGYTFVKVSRNKAILRVSIDLKRRLERYKENLRTAIDRLTDGCIYQLEIKAITYILMVSLLSSDTIFYFLKGSFQPANFMVE